MKIAWSIKHLYYQIGILAFFLMLWATPFQIHWLLLVGYTFMALFEYQMTGKLYIDTLIWSSVIIGLNIFWIYKDLIGENFHKSECQIGH